jgi:peptide deformylase
MLKIVSVPNPILTSPARKVEKIDKKIVDMVIDMEETLIAQIDPQGVGLAAPQVGMALRLFIVKPSPDVETEVFINPVVVESVVKPEKVATKPKRKKESKLEGCLSIPRIWGTVTRAQKILVTYQTLEGSHKKKWFTGLKSIIVQHEIDHLNGVLFTQRALEQKKQLYEEKDGEFEKVKEL